jgi:hypothetical protein
MPRLPEGVKLEIVGDKVRLDIGIDPGGMTAVFTLTECEQLARQFQKRANKFRADRERLRNVAARQRRAFTGRRLQCRGKAA